MSIFSIAYNNFKSNIRTYMAFFISMVFSVVVLTNFEILKYGETIKVLEGENRKFTEAMLISVIVVLTVFLFFFIWYATNVFFKSRVKEIGILSFMGLDLYTIGKIYFVENMLIGVSACITGVLIGIISSRFFQVIIIKLSGYEIDVSNDFSMRAIISSSVIFISIFLIMTIKGFITIYRSSIISLINASKKAEKIPKVGLGLYVLAIISIVMIGYGYYLSMDIRRGNIMDVVPVIIMIIVGTYGLFKSVIPVIFNILMKNKKILFNGENIIAINNINYRLNKNYKTYAIISIVITTTISTLGAAVAIKDRQENAEMQRTTYTVSILSSNKDDINKSNIDGLIKQTNNINYSVNPELTVIENKNSKYEGDLGHIIMKYSDLVNILKVNGQEESIKELDSKLVESRKIIELKSPQTIGSFAKKEFKVDIAGEIYSISKGEVSTPVLGVGFGEYINIVNDKEYESLRKKCIRSTYK